MSSPVRILVVCLGNICRSPAAEAAIEEASEAAGVHVRVESAGTGPWHVGQPPDPRIRAAGERAGMVVDGTARQITDVAELEGYDVILAMDRHNLAAVRRIAPHLGDRIHLFRSFDPHADHDEVPDPYGKSDASFDETIRIARAGARGVVEALGSGRLP